MVIIIELVVIVAEAGAIASITVFVPKELHAHMHTHHVN